MGILLHLPIIQLKRKEILDLSLLSQDECYIVLQGFVLAIPANKASNEATLSILDEPEQLNELIDSTLVLGTASWLTTHDIGNSLVSQSKDDSEVEDSKYDTKTNEFIVLPQQLFFADSMDSIDAKSLTGLCSGKCICLRASTTLVSISSVDLGDQTEDQRQTQPTTTLVKLNINSLSPMLEKVKSELPNVELSRDVPFGWESAMQTTPGFVP